MMPFFLTSPFRFFFVGQRNSAHKTKKIVQRKKLARVESIFFRRTRIYGTLVSEPTIKFVELLLLWYDNKVKGYVGCQSPFAFTLGVETCFCVKKIAWMGDVACVSKLVR